MTSQLHFHLSHVQKFRTQFIWSVKSFLTKLCLSMDLLKRVQQMAGMFLFQMRFEYQTCQHLNYFQPFKYRTCLVSEPRWPMFLDHGFDLNNIFWSIIQMVDVFQILNVFEAIKGARVKHENWRDCREKLSCFVIK